MFLVADRARYAERGRERGRERARRGGLGLALLGIAVALLLVACGQSEPQAAAPTTAARPTTAPATSVPPTAVPATAVPPTTAPPTTAPTAPPAAPALVELLAVDNRFEPAYAEVPRGTTVRWVNRGQDDHDVTSEDFKTISSPVIKPGQTFDITLTQPGSIPYVCSLHVGMTATLVVR